MGVMVLVIIPQLWLHPLIWRILLYKVDLFRENVAIAKISTLSIVSKMLQMKGSLHRRLLQSCLN
jgi:hypothetical protein